MNEKEHARIRAAAAAAHEANRQWCLLNGDESQPRWEDAPSWQAESAFQGAKTIAEDLSTTPRQSHESWMKAKEADGWVYGEVKDSDAKTHPCMVPYDELSQYQRMKDYIFGQVVRAMLGQPPLVEGITLEATNPN